jgi:hypothetical protein
VVVVKLPAAMADVFTRIQNATDAEICTVLAGLCADGTTKRRVERMFRQLYQTAKAYEQRRLALPTLYICLNCSMAFNEAQNTRGACRHHPGRLCIQLAIWKL